jgi:hypothetical protein
VNDYVSGLNLDQGHAPSQTFQTFNAEGAGFGGERNCWKPRSISVLRILSLICEPAKNGVRLFVVANWLGSETSIQARFAWIDSRWERFYNGGPANVRDFLEGDLAEILIFDRALSEEERQQVDGIFPKNMLSCCRRVSRPARSGAIG